MVGALAFTFSLLVAPVAFSAPSTESPPDANKAQVEYHEALEVAGQTSAEGVHNKAQIEYFERQALDDNVSAAANHDKAQIEYGERLEAAGRTSSEGQPSRGHLEFSEGEGSGVGSSFDGSHNKAYIEYLERQGLDGQQPNAPAEPVEPADTSVGFSVSGWQLGLSVLAGAIIGAAAVASARMRKRTAPKPVPDEQESLPV